jgi:hypothetical protein
MLTIAREEPVKHPNQTDSEYKARVMLVDALDHGLVHYKAWGSHSYVVADSSVFPALDLLGIPHMVADRGMKESGYVHVVDFKDWAQVFGNLGRTSETFDGRIIVH